MDLRYLAFLEADPDVYDDAWQAPTDPHDRLGPTHVPAGVTVADGGPWRTYRTPAPLPSSGWKVHVSCRPERAAHVVDTVVTAALALGASCKHLRSRRLVAASQGKYADPAGAGKVLTLYPVDDAHLAALLDRLTADLAGEPGARVLSDVPVPGAPLGVRFGAYLGIHHVDASGHCRPGRVGDDGAPCADDRRPHRGGASSRPAPAVVVRLQEEAASRDRAAVLPVRDVRVLHRTNAGGVYAATWEDGRRVVLKEARRHTGFDRGETDAVTRLRHELVVLRRLAGTGAVPEVVDHRDAGDSEFLVLEHVDGPVATATMARTHPAAVAGADHASYRRWVDVVVDRTHEALDVLHARGVTHLDVHAGNVIERDGRVVLVDLESAALDGVAVARGVATSLSSCGDDTTPEADLAALGRMRSLLVNPQFDLTTRRPDLREELLRAGCHDLAGPDPAAPPATEPAGDAPDARRLVRGLEVLAHPHRSDRLVPGDIAGFGTPGGGLGLLHGAGGVLAALHAGGHEVPSRWRSWLVDAATSAPYLPPGLADGADGIALCLARIGEPEAARTVIGRWGPRESPSPWWARGTAGQAVAHAELAVALDDPGLASSALRLLATTLDALAAPHPAPGYRAGLLDGWAGIGLALLRTAELLARAGLPDGLPHRLRAAARQAVDREIPAVHRQGPAWLASDGRRLLPYLGTGSAALGLLAAALGGDPDRQDGEDSRCLDQAVRGVRAALRLPCVSGAGLMHGRAGVVVALGLLAPGDETVATHRRRLGWHTLPVTGTGRREHPLAEHADLVLGEQNLRASADLGTGAAGVLLATDGTVPEVGRRAAGLLCLPAALATRAVRHEDMTPVMTRR